MSWGIAETASEIEKIKSESADYLNGLNSCGVIDWNTYNYAFDFYEDLLIKAYEQGRKDAQPEQHLDEWCDSCKEYDKEKHSCPRWNKVIKNTVDELKSAQPEPCEDAVSRKAVIDTIDEWKEACADSGHKETVSDIMLIRKDFIELPSVTPKQRTGKWIKKHRHYGGFRSYTGFDAMGEQHTVTVDERAEYDDLYCSECGARSADNFLNFCPNCGLKMMVANDEGD